MINVGRTWSNSSQIRPPSATFGPTWNLGGDSAPGATFRQLLGNFSTTFGRADFPQFLGKLTLLPFSASRGTPHGSRWVGGVNDSKSAAQSCAFAKLRGRRSAAWTVARAALAPTGGEVLERWRDDRNAFAEWKNSLSEMRPSRAAAGVRGERGADRALCLPRHAVLFRLCCVCSGSFSARHARQTCWRRSLRAALFPCAPSRPAA